MPKALTIQQVEGSPGKVYYPLRVVDVPRASPGPNEVLVRLAAASLNHRDLFIRRHLYPAISFANPLLADGYGTVVEAGPACTVGRELVGHPVLLTPCRGWAASPDGPEDPARFAIIGASKLSTVGTAQEYVVVDEREVEPAPAHLSPAEGAALPLVGLTAWRAFVTKSGNAEPGRNILLTGVGGGVALQAMQFAVAVGCNVFVTSGDSAKIDRAKSLGAVGGVLYRSDAWEKELQALLPASRPYLDAVVDGAGGDIVARVVRLLKPGGIIVQYGMTLAPRMDWPVQAVLKNIELRGSTMGSRKEFGDMVAFVAEKKIKPVVSRVVSGLDNVEAIDGLFDDMDKARQFGKLVIEISASGDDSPSKL